MIKMPVCKNNPFNVIYVNTVLVKDWEYLVSVARIAGIDEGVFYLTLFLIVEYIDIGTVAKEKIRYFGVAVTQSLFYYSMRIFRWSASMEFFIFIHPFSLYLQDHSLWI